MMLVLLMLAGMSKLLRNDAAFPSSQRSSSSNKLIIPRAVWGRGPRQAVEVTFAVFRFLVSTKTVLTFNFYYFLGT